MINAHHSCFLSNPCSGLSDYTICANLKLYKWYKLEYHNSQYPKSDEISSNILNDIGLPPKLTLLLL